MVHPPVSVADAATIRAGDKIECVGAETECGLLRVTRQGAIVQIRGDVVE